MDVALFLIFAAIAVICGINLVVRTHPIQSALSLIGVMGSIAVLYLLLGAEFIAAIQIIVYAGAIMVLFVFVIMLLNAGGEPKAADRSKLVRWLGIPLFTIFLGVLSYLVRKMAPEGAQVAFGKFTGGGPREVGRILFTQYLLPFEATSVLVLIAILGAIVLARKELD
ncbi:MAG: NADH-quinone oxidoreductase subunit J [Acidobacteria bacterium]|nr:NADH-quinone oxidoreductase subunit J [Acidobacteriota bacterium]